MLTDNDRQRIEQKADNILEILYHSNRVFKDALIEIAEYATIYERETWIKQCEELIRTRNVMSEGYKLEIKRLEAERSELSNLLAIMHGDGGHHQQKVGTKQAIIDAIELIHKKWVTNEHLKDVNQLSEHVSTLKETLDFDAACKVDLEFRINELEQLLKMCIVRCTDAKMTSALYKEIRAALKLP